MTAKEKAKDLVERFLALKKINLNAITRPYNWQEAKQCALICVDEIINTGVHQDYIKVDGYMLSLVEFYTEVKQEINKL
tara:strand:+ start:273 stop:509 length:237 start_codon:yes stop_codon:yes gene_type:complete